MTHDELVSRASKWLRSVGRCPIVLTEFNIGKGEIPDVIGWGRGGRRSVLIECKVSYSDFKADKEKKARKKGNEIGQEKLYFAPKGLLKKSEIPEGWGLIELGTDGKVYQTYRPRRRFKSEVAARELPYLFKALLYYHTDPRIAGSNPLTLRQKDGFQARPPDSLGLADFPNCSRF